MGIEVRRPITIQAEVGGWCVRISRRAGVVGRGGGRDRKKGGRDRKKDGRGTGCGTGRGTVVGTRLLGQRSRPVFWLIGREKKVDCENFKALEDPIVIMLPATNAVGIGVGLAEYL